MSLTEMVDLVRRWFAQAAQADGPLLPDGWFGGRAGESVFFLEDAEAIVADGSLVLHLSEGTTLHFRHPGRVFVENSDLVIDGYKYAAIRWQHYGGGPDAPFYEREYSDGQVRLCAPVGKTVTL